MLFRSANNANRVTFSNKHNAYWQYPNLQTKKFFSPKLDRTVKLKVATSTIRTIRKLGLDETAAKYGGAECEGDRLAESGCEIMPCPQDCGNRGICQYGKCFCDLGYAGEACEKKVACPLNCNSNGMCHHGQCDCNPGFSGETCEAQTGEQCKNDCNHHGRCYMGKCWCQPGYEGDDCGILNHPNIPDRKSVV